MVSSIAIGLGMPAWSGGSEPEEMHGLNVFALRGVVAAALTTRREPTETAVEPHHPHRHPRPPDQTFPIPFIR
ncbi:MAG TPA: hypothetical protein VHM29_02730 [Acidimicrobiia bacterium]|jgi:hypothetical protein|nr:hypothetical protein [Acidimicrobiia bacterium]